ncbi:hypothetical protein fugu_009294 [Takifugu bimaculatus]|uniref:Uncharacterized protein n=1 Tax=Takifugu bimaculatus TaxID=433685 RepID=A0A4Z2B085_9TELE|nr:hypothetical protein fugu_009294 [Takifugu bimaculatus]
MHPIYDSAHLSFRNKYDLPPSPQPGVRQIHVIKRHLCATKTVLIVHPTPPSPRILPTRGARGAFGVFSGLRARRDVLRDMTESWSVGNEKRSVLRSGPGPGPSNRMERQAGISQCSEVGAVQC